LPAARRQGDAILLPPPGRDNERGELGRMENHPPDKRRRIQL
jgi:hypothetical protein